MLLDPGAPFWLSKILGSLVEFVLALGMPTNSRKPRCPVLKLQNTAFNCQVHMRNMQADKTTSRANRAH